MVEFTHFNHQGRAKMVDVSDKEITARTAAAGCSLEVTKEIYDAVTGKKIKKGDVFSVAQVAGIMAAKNTPQTIPMCHPLPLSGIDIRFEWDTEQDYLLNITAEVKTTGRTGVEMEALTAVSAAALTVYDMCKAIDKGMVIKETRLLSKTGGKSGDYQR